jgi:very-short-patch-repair endonuclease
LRLELADFFSLDREDRFFVKNLETVQGDERDAIILSVGYGKAANGELPHRFGPLTQDAGYRRLNVAVTRAKRRMCLISSFAHHDVDLNRSGSRGVQLLKAYLEYAGSGGARMSEVESAGRVELNAFEADVRDALTAAGIVTRPQYGASRYRIDLVAMHPQRVGRPVLAIECDGASYHSSATARDRDRLRQAHLQKLGWQFHRVWSTDWFYRRDEEIGRAVAAWEEAARRADVLDADGGSGSGRGGAAAGGERIESGRRTANESALERDAQQLRVLAAATRPSTCPFIPDRATIDEYSDRDLRKLAEWVASDGRLRTDEALIREVFALLPFQRMGGRIRERLERVVTEVRPGR